MSGYCSSCSNEASDVIVICSECEELQNEEHEEIISKFETQIEKLKSENEKIVHNSKATIRALDSIVDNWDKFPPTTSLAVIVKLRNVLKEVEGK